MEHICLSASVITTQFLWLEKPSLEKLLGVRKNSKITGFSFRTNTDQKWFPFFLKIK